MKDPVDLHKVHKHEDITSPAIDTKYAGEVITLIEKFVVIQGKYINMKTTALHGYFVILY